MKLIKFIMELKKYKIKNEIKNKIVFEKNINDMYHTVTIRKNLFNSKQYAIFIEETNSKCYRYNYYSVCDCNSILMLLKYVLFLK